MTVSKIGEGNNNKYILRIASDSAAVFTVGDANSGKRINAVKLEDEYSELIDKNAIAKRGNTIDLEASNRFEENKNVSGTWIALAPLTHNASRCRTTPAGNLVLFCCTKKRD